MEKYGTDKPDLRIPIEIVDVTDIFKSDNTNFKIFKEKVIKGNVVKAIPVPNTNYPTKKFF